VKPADIQIWIETYQRYPIYQPPRWLQMHPDLLYSPPDWLLLHYYGIGGPSDSTINEYLYQHHLLGSFLDRHRYLLGWPPELYRDFNDSNEPNRIDE